MNMTNEEVLKEEANPFRKRLDFIPVHIWRKDGLYMVGEPDDGGVEIEANAFIDHWDGSIYEVFTFDGELVWVYGKDSGDELEDITQSYLSEISDKLRYNYPSDQVVKHKEAMI